MWIDSIQIDGFGLFDRGVEIDFGDAPVVVLVGDNESGKTTLMEAIVATIFGFTKQENEDARRPWLQHRSYSSTIALRLSDSSRIVISRDFDSNAVTMRQFTDEAETNLFAGKASPRSRSAEAQRYFSLLEELLGFGDVMLFMASVFVRQEQLETQLSDRIRRVASGSVSTDYEKAGATLKEKYFQLTRHNPWDGRDKTKNREIEQLVEERKEVTEKLDKQGEVQHNISKLLEQQQQNREEIEQIAHRLEQDQNVLQNVAELNRLNEEKKQARERESTLRREVEILRETRTRMNSITTDLKEKYPDFDGADMPFQQKLARAAELDDELTRREQALQIEERRWETALHKEKRVAAPILSVLFALAGGVTGFEAASAAGCLAGILVGGTLGYLLSQLMPAFPGGKAATTKGRVSMSREEVELTKERRERLIREIETLCGTTDVAAVSVQFEEYRALKNQLSTAEGLLETFRPEDEIENEYEKTVQELAVAETQIKELLRTATTLNQVQDDLQEALALETSLRESSEGLKKDLEAKKEREMELKLEIARLSGVQEQSRPQLEETLEQIKSKLAQLALNRDALKCAIDILSEAIADYRKGYLPILEDEITELFRHIVGDRYNRVHFSANLEPRIDGAAHADIAPDTLSAGTRDQLYLAMRLAFARQISRGGSLPLILDDPFANFDEHRLEAACQILTSVGGDQQVILFTHDRRLTDWGDVAIDLNDTAAPSA